MVASSSLPLVVLTGPTAAGKTQLAMDLYDAMRCRLISVDSAQVYHGMNIGTAKPDATELANYPHALINIIEPDMVYNVASFIRDAEYAITEARNAGELPVLVGGTTMYIQSLLDGLDDLPAADMVLRADINAEAEEHGWPALHERLVRHNPALASTINPNDAQRIQRALEISLCMDRRHKRLSSGQEKNHLSVLVAPVSRDVLHQRIEQRVQIMLEKGLVDEVKGLLSQYPLSVEDSSMRSVGYRQTLAMLNGEVPESELKTAIVQATRQLAKRQLTWCRQRSGMLWLDAAWPGKSAFLLKRIQFFVSNYQLRQV